MSHQLANARRAGHMKRAIVSFTLGCIPDPLWKWLRVDARLMKWGYCISLHRINLHVDIPSHGLPTVERID